MISEWKLLVVKIIMVVIRFNSPMVEYMKMML